MADTTAEIVPYEPVHLKDILDLSILAWDPVFPLMKDEIPDYVYSAFYPDGWKARQLADITAICRDDETSVRVALVDDSVAGFMGIRVHEEDSMGEIYVIAVHPDYQRRGVGSALMSFAFDWLRRRDLKMVMVETGGDKGHAQSRAISVNSSCPQRTHPRGVVDTMYPRSKRVTEIPYRPLKHLWVLVGTAESAVEVRHRIVERS